MPGSFQNLYLSVSGNKHMVLPQNENDINTLPCKASNLVTFSNITNQMTTHFICWTTDRRQTFELNFYLPQLGECSGTKISDLQLLKLLSKDISFHEMLLNRSGQIQSVIIFIYFRPSKKKSTISSHKSASKSFFFANQWITWYMYTRLLEPNQISHTQSMVAKRGLTNRANVQT